MDTLALYDHSSTANAIMAFSNIESRVSTIANYSNREELLKIIDTCNNLISDLTKEAITCRRTKRITAEFESITQQFVDTVRTLGELFTFAVLLDS
jgi:hypothetical protein